MATVGLFIHYKHNVKDILAFLHATTNLDVKHNSCNLPTFKNFIQIYFKLSSIEFILILLLKVSQQSGGGINFVNHTMSSAGIDLRLHKVSHEMD